MNCSSIDELLAGMEDIATLPATIIDLLCLMDNPVSSAENVQKVLERDVAMTANILKLGNSAYYGSRRQITSVRQAIVMLGNRSVATLAFAAGMAPVMRRDLNNYNLKRDDFWQHSLISAAASSLAADQLGISHRHCEAFTVGLVHDVGMLIIDAWLEEQGRTLNLSEVENHDFRQVEKQCLGFDHADVGASLARRWGFPDFFVDVIAHHHDYDMGGDKFDDETGALIKSVAAGNLMAVLISLEVDAAGAVVESERLQYDEVLAELTTLGIEPESIDELCLDLTENLEETLTSATRCTVLN